MDKSTIDKSNLFKKGIMTLLTLLVIVYVVYVVGRASFTQIRTETAKQMTVYNSIDTTGYVIRDEKLISYNGDGVISYSAEDGEKVSSGEAVATVFASNTAANTNQEIKRLEEQLASLEQLRQSTDTIVETPDAIDKNIDSALAQVNIALADGNINSAQSGIDTVLYNINERQLLTGKLTSLDDKIKQIENKVNSLKKESADSQKGKTISANATGYFVSSADGYEGLYTTSDLDKLTLDSLSSDKIKPKTVDEKVIGKTIEGVYWYIACKVDAEEAIKIKDADSLSVDIPLASSQKISVDLYSLNQKSKTDDAVVILRGSYMNAEMSSIRNEEISIIIDTYNGIYVPKGAVHDAKVTRTVETSDGKETEETETITGVYVRIGTELEFKQIIPVYSGDDFIICDMSPDSEQVFSSEVGTLQLYDEIVVEGANLYDGKIVNRTS